MVPGKKGKKEGKGLFLKLNDEGARDLSHIARLVDKDEGSTVSLALSLLESVVMFRRMGHRIYIDLGGGQKEELVIRSEEESQKVRGKVISLSLELQQATTDKEKQRIIERIQELYHVRQGS